MSGTEIKIKMTDNQQEPSANWVYCLSIDLIGSTEAGMKLSTRNLKKFNISLVEQIKPHLENLELTDVLVKFTGDGWLLMTDNANRVPALCCLSIIMANRFQDEMSRKTGMVIDKIPRLKIAICSGRDVRVTLPGGGTDWVGDSARRADRASEWCSRSHNEILIDEPIRYVVSQDFATKPTDLKQRPQPKKCEEDLTLHVLGEINPEIAADSEADGYFVYTLDAIGKRKEAAVVAQQGGERCIDVANKKKEIPQGTSRKWNRLISNIRDYSTAFEMLKNGRAAGFAPNVVTYNTLISKAPDYDEAKTWVETMRQEHIHPNVVTYTTLISQAPDYDEANDLVETMQKEGIQPDVVTYNTLISKAPYYDIAKDWVGTMLQDGVLPNVVTYNTLISKAPDYDEAKTWVETMQQEDIQPDVVTYTTLISKAPDYDEAKTLVETMQKDSILPNVVTYNTLFSKDLLGKSADEILSWYLAQAYHPVESIQTAIAAYRKSHHIDQALRLALDYPHTEAARKVIRANAGEALAYFSSISERDPNHPNADYALGISFMELGMEMEAQPHLEKALELAKPGPRKAAIEEWLRQISHKLSHEE